MIVCRDLAKLLPHVVCLYQAHDHFTLPVYALNCDVAVYVAISPVANKYYPQKFIQHAI